LPSTPFEAATAESVAAVLRSASMLMQQGVAARTATRQALQQGREAEEAEADAEAGGMDALMDTGDNCSLVQGGKRKAFSAALCRPAATLALLCRELNLELDVDAEEGSSTPGRGAPGRDSGRVRRREPSALLMPRVPGAGLGGGVRQEPWHLELIVRLACTARPAFAQRRIAALVEVMAQAGAPLVTAKHVTNAVLRHVPASRPVGENDTSYAGLSCEEIPGAAGVRMLVLRMAGQHPAAMEVALSLGASAAAIHMLEECYTVAVLHGASAQEDPVDSNAAKEADESLPCEESSRQYGQMFSTLLQWVMAAGPAAPGAHLLPRILARPPPTMKPLEALRLLKYAQGHSGHDWPVGTFRQFLLSFASTLS